MKRAILAALCLCVAAQAHAFNPVASATPRVLPVRTLPLTSTHPLARRVLVVLDGRDDALNQSNVKADAAAMAKLLGPTFDAWRILNDVQVDVVRTEFFELPADSSIGDAGHLQGPAYLWQTLGTYYPTVVCVGFNADGGTSRKRYYSADSTTAKIIHIGGWVGSTWTDSTVFGVCDVGGTGTYFDSRKAAVSAYANTHADTLWTFAGYGMRPATLQSGVASVVRLFQPLKLANYFGWGADSTSGVYPTGTDTVAAAGEIMPLAWRVYWTTSGRATDFVKFAGTASYGAPMGHVLTALVSRTTLMRPAPAAMEWDDMFDNNPTTSTRPANSAVDSIVVEFLQTWGVPVTFSINPRHAAEYYAGTDPTRESAWEHSEGWTWIRRGIPWVHHSHDSTSSDIASGLVGRFGGYSTDNGAIDSAGTNVNTRYLYSHRYGIAAVNGDAYTIKYRLAWSDSVRRSICPECFTPPYLSFPNNEMLPIDWRESTGQSVASAVRSGFVSRWKSYQGDGLMPVDSVLSAFHAGLRIPEGGTLYLRTGTANNGPGSAGTSYEAHGLLASGATGGPPGDDAPNNWLVSGDGDSVVAKTPFAYPGDRTASRIDGRIVRTRNITPTPYDGIARANYMVNVQRALSAIMGCRTGTLTSSGFSTWAEAYAADPGGVLTAAGTQRNFGTANARMVYLHPSATGTGWSFATGPQTSYAIQVARLGLLGGLRTLESVAGHRLIQWRYPWEVYR